MSEFPAEPMTAAFEFAVTLIRTSFTAGFNDTQVMAVTQDWLAVQDGGEYEALPFLVFAMPAAVFSTVMASNTPVVLPDPDADPSLTAERRGDLLAAVRALKLIQASRSEEGIEILRDRLAGAVDMRESALRIVADCVAVGVKACSLALRRTVQPWAPPAGGRHRLVETADRYGTSVSDGGAGEES
jgi:hypothetical protein